MDEYVVALQGMKSLEQVQNLIKNVGPSLVRAINSTAAWGRDEARQVVGAEVNFTPAYLRSPGRLGVTRASSGNYEAVIIARSRASSLARFSKQTKPGLAVSVLRGVTKTLPGAFLMKLRNGNVGAAIPEDRYYEIPGVGPARYKWRNLVFLYGPSVDQVFRTHRPELADDVRDRLAEEFLALV